jgi:predicted nucleic acid-binding protein
LKGIIVSDATPIIAFSRIGELGLLQQIVGEIIIPEEVAREIFEYKKTDIKDIKSLQWIKTKKVKSKKEVDILLATLDTGEAEVIISGTLFSEYNNY